MASSAAMGSAPGSYQRWLATAALVVLPFMVVVLVMTAQFRGVELPAALEQGVVARRLAAGQGYTTAVILPRSLAYNASLTAHPELRQAPLSVLPAAVLSRAMGEREGRVLAFSSMLAFLATVWLAYALARALAGGLAAWTAALLVTFAPAVLSAAVSGDGRLWAMPLLVLLWLVLSAPLAGPAKALGAGALIALAALTSYQLLLPLMLAVLPVLLVSHHPAPPRTSPEAPPSGPLVERSWRQVGLAVGLVLLLCLPWLVRNQRVAGTPFPGVNSYSVMSLTDAAPGRSIERRYLDPGASPLSFVQHHQRQLVQKVLTGFSHLRVAVGQTLEWLLLGLFVAALLVPLGGGRESARRALLWAIAWHALLLTIGSQEFRVLVVWLPLCAVYAAVMVAERLATTIAEPRRAWLLTWQPEARRRWAVAGLVMALALPGLAPQMFGGRGTTASPSAPSHKLLADQVAEDQAIATDDPWQVAWHSDRLAIWLPQSADDLEAMQKLGEVKAIYFSQRVAPAAGQFTARERGDWWSWAQAMPQGFLDYRPLESRVPGERILIRSTAR